MENEWQVVWQPLIELFQRGLGPRWNGLEMGLFCSCKNDEQ